MEETLSGESFSQDISNLVFKWKKSNINSFLQDLFTNKMIINFHMFSPRMKNRICSQISSVEIITVKKQGTETGEQEFFKYGLDPSVFNDCISETFILKFDTRARNHLLFRS